ncbi:hypothetical protein E8F11_22075 [Pseudomonas sp. BN417]|uniref:hypothetical protein n=1 Tax=Pseudomonas sp. BN417 TaxID=2567890 RepID=UPI002453C64B|nr:hypothetical protein [Pseudomonas sp. BN417]MDH4557824.1 hypothetical protein [Pseudomonas sp. BN417]
MLQPDLSVTLSQRRRSCVLDPALALATPFGPQLVERLAPWLELWMARAFWHILDSSEFFLSRPEQLFADLHADPAQQVNATQSLRLWEQRRTQTDCANLPFHWIGDCTSESSLPSAWQNGAGSALIQRYETLHISLVEREWQRDGGGRSELRLARLDALALAAALGQAFVLTTRTEHGPQLCDDVAALKLAESAEALSRGTSGGALAGTEREWLCQLLAQAGVAPLVLAGLPLAVVHVLAPAASLLAVQPVEEPLPALAEADPELDALLEDELATAHEAALDPWGDARIFWYPL